ncbi:hypothetical protein P154DRAFT_519955 [Amniculicola lignicola CBS 123094]|uniref:Uncharacterized protein n=1 Tax=Amniculicola lignicola CBS 123094 TaxID=1392246 RepID=A0A6A5WQD6_9PLEO|nr:hypothetical protein P154DRAFT_519955 [Amniculicola lignicola CBS 123094]
MPTRTRNSNKDAEHTVYYSKKVPKQKLFPERRKTVRSKPGRDDVVPEPKQTTLKSQKRRSNEIVEDSEGDEDDEEELEEQESPPPAKVPRRSTKATPKVPRKPRTRGRKRNSDVLQEAQLEEDEAPVRPIAKRRRTARQPTNDEATELPSPAPSSELEEEEQPRRGKKQSTMTQLVDGRLPRLGEKEPKFKPLKRTPRTSWGSRKSKSAEKDRKQQTLTQMVPGLTMLGIMSDDDMEEALDDLEQENSASELHQAAIARHQARRRSPLAAEGSDGEIAENIPVVVPRTQNERPEENEAGLEEDDDEDAYEPTQHVEAPKGGRRRSTRPSSRNQKRKSPAEATASTPKRRSTTSKYSLLATPTRRVLELRSSQSPAESEFSTQDMQDRTPLKEREANSLRIEDTPSKRKQVTFQELPKDVEPSPRRRRFGSVIRDSDDEDNWSEDEDIVTGQTIGANTQAIIRGIENPIPAKNVGSETQAILAQIDQACAHAEEASVWDERESSQELGNGPTITYEESQELGTPNNALQDENEDMDDDAPSSGQRRSIKVEPFTQNIASLPKQRDVDSSQNIRPSNVDETLEEANSPNGLSGSAPLAETSSNDDLPTTPVIIKDECSDDDDTIHPTPPPATALQESSLLDLDGEPIQVPRSPSPPPSKPQDTTASHSSRAEHQLLVEWTRYSQHQRMRLPPPSSTNNPYPPSTIPPSRQYPHPNSHSHPKSTHTGISQATTIDLPSQIPLHSQPSTHTTPRKTHHTQSLVSPERPPSLVIPSSFPSPSKAMVDEWSSPIFGNTMFGGTLDVDNFSIPAPPPGMGMEEGQWDDEDKEM